MVVLTAGGYEPGCCGVVTDGQTPEERYDYQPPVGGRRGRSIRASFVDGRPREANLVPEQTTGRLPRYGSAFPPAFIAERHEPYPFHVGERWVASLGGLDGRGRRLAQAYEPSPGPASASQMVEDSGQFPTYSPLRCWKARRDGRLDDLLHGPMDRLNRSGLDQLDGAFRPRGDLSARLVARRTDEAVREYKWS